MAKVAPSIVEASSFSSRRLSEMQSIAWSGGVDRLGPGVGRFPVEIFRLMGLTEVASSIDTIIDTIAEFSLCHDRKSLTWLGQ